MKFSRDEIDKRFQSQLAISQIVALVLYGIFYRDIFKQITLESTQALLIDGVSRYVFFYSTHLMVVLGFALLLTFLHRHRLTTMVTCFWVGCLSAQFYFIWNAFWSFLLTPERARLSVEHIIGGEFCSASVLIAVCGIIGKATNYQYFLMTMFFLPIYTLNEVFLLEILGTRDLGGSMIIHTFGACFGLAVAYHLNYPKSGPSNPNLYASQTSFTTALIGTILLWACWPSFNAAQAKTPLDINLAIINTYFGLNASVVATLLLSVYFFKGKFDLEQMANATLAGGVIMGSGADMIRSGFVSNFMGLLGGALSTFLFEFAPPILQQKGLHDVAGIFNLHCIPGIVGGLMSIIFRAIWIDDGAYTQFIGLIATIILSVGFGHLTGVYIRPFHDGSLVNDFYNDLYFARLHSPISKKLESTIETERRSQEQLFDQDEEKNSSFSEKMLGQSSELKETKKSSKTNQ